MHERYEVVYRAAMKYHGKYWVYDEETRGGKIVTGDYMQYSRPYSTPGPAKTAVTKARRSSYADFVDGWVEVSTGWKVLDED